MLSIICISILAVYFLVISLKLKEYCSENTTNKITRPLSIIIKISPIVGMLIFTILFTFVLKGRSLERITHAILVFALWMYATQFYQYILSYYKKKGIFIGSMIGMILSIILAIIFTPLERYVSIFYSYMNWTSIFLSGILYIIFYTVAFIIKKRVN